MTISRIAGLATKVEVDTNFLARDVQALEDHLGATLAELALVVLPLIGAFFWCCGVEVEGKPRRGEGVLRIRMGGLVKGNAFLELVFAHIAL